MRGVPRCAGSGCSDCSQDRVGGTRLEGAASQPQAHWLIVSPPSSSLILPSYMYSTSASTFPLGWQVVHKGGERVDQGA